ncbi:MAG TPA: glycosyltransferase family 9 protein [Steroidobacteraceae bacterium]
MTPRDGEPPVSCKPWRSQESPRLILAMRFQALGDTLITLPYLLSLKRRFPQADLHFLTRDEVCQVPAAVDVFDRVFTFGGGRSRMWQLLSVMGRMPSLLAQRYDLVLDLQNSHISRLVRRLIAPRAWAEFDRFSPRSAGERNRRTIAAAIDCRPALDTGLTLRRDPDVDTLLREHGWKPGHELVVLNPAGYSPARAWPIENYCEFARLWIARHPRTQIVLLLLPSQRDKSRAIAAALGDACVDLTGHADQLQAFAIAGRARLVLSEDSGLMHMSWVQGTPTLALFSTSRKDWSAPQGSWSDCLDSSDLPCGPCGLEVCRFGDNRCLTRYDARLVAERAEMLVRPEISKCG